MVRYNLTRVLHEPLEWCEPWSNIRSTLSVHSTHLCTYIHPKLYLGMRNVTGMVCNALGTCEPSRVRCLFSAVSLVPFDAVHGEIRKMFFSFHDHFVTKK